MFVLVWIGVVGGAEIVSKVQVDGVRFVPAQDVRAWLLTRSGSPVDSVLLRKDVDKILDEYRDLGFWNVAVVFPEITPNHRGLTVRFAINEGPQTHIDSVSVDGDFVFAKADVQNAFSLKRSTVLVESDLRQRLGGLLRFYENRGYPYCVLDPEVKFVDLDARVKVNVIPGPFVRIDTIRFEGNHMTRADVLLRQLKFEAMEIYDQRRVDVYARRLERLSFIDRVYDLTLEQNGEVFTLVIEVKETQHTRVEGALGIGSNTGQALTGAIALDVLNFAGGGREGQALWSRQGQGVSNLSVFYREPWILHSPISGWATVEMDERLGYVTHRFSGGGDVYFGEGARGFGGVAYSRVLPDSTGLGIHLEERLWSLESGVWIDRRDDNWNPRQGWRAKLSGEWGEVAEGIYRTIWKGDGQIFWALGGQSVISARGRAFWVGQTRGVPETALLRLGGAKTLRGYNEEAFLGSRAGWVNLEWRWLLGPMARVFAFVDAGSVAGFGTTAWPMAYGIGILANRRGGAVGIDFGLPRGQSLGQGMVHVRMVGEF